VWMVDTVPFGSGSSTLSVVPVVSSTPRTAEGTTEATRAPGPQRAPLSEDAGTVTRSPAPVLPRGEPDRVVIPAIGVDESLVRLGLRRDRSMEVPAFGLAGWYDEGPMPGHPGPAVVVAHLDSWSGPDVFANLRRLAVGDRVHIDFDSGDRVTFVVTMSEQTAKTALPVASIWPLTTVQLLTLITCGGDFDRSAGHYLDNLIVYTELLEHVPRGWTSDES